MQTKIKVEIPFEIRTDGRANRQTNEQQHTGLLVSPSCLFPMECWMQRVFSSVGCLSFFSGRQLSQNMYITQFYTCSIEIVEYTCINIHMYIYYICGVMNRINFFKLSNWKVSDRNSTLCLQGNSGLEEKMF